MNKKTFVGIDPGSESSGIIVITEKGIREGYNLPNPEVLNFIYNEFVNCEGHFALVIEDVRPYNMRITDGIIKNIKFLGELEYRLTISQIKYTLIPRWQVKQWIFLQFKPLALAAIEKKIQDSNKRKEKKEQKVNYNQSPTFVYVDDRIVANAMRKHWGIKNPTKVGQKAMYNLQTHSWQALGLVSYYMALNGLKITQNGL